jgi:tryptophan synthase alpha chain
MSRISQTFERLRRDKQKALIPFITAGYPDLSTTRALIVEFEKCGADLVELGVPFSDPMADGPLIQYASEQSLSHGTSLDDILRLVATVRRRTSIPVILMGYYNPFFKFGLEHFTRKAAQAGVDGVLVVDLPPEEAAEMKRFTDQAGLDLIFLLAPTSGPGRVDRIVRHASGFIYYVSLTGVTGVRSTLDRSIRRQIAAIRRKSTLPIAVGFGISTPEHARTVARWSDAVVVGSAIIKIISGCRSAQEKLQKTGHFIRTLKKAMQ